MITIEKKPKQDVMTENNDMLSPYEVFEGTAWEAGLLKSILDDNEIENFIKDASRIPWNTFPVSASSVKVFVAKKDYEAAMGIVNEFRDNMKEEAEMDPEDENS